MALKPWCVAALVGWLLLALPQTVAEELIELDESEEADGIEPFLTKHLEPFGAAVVAYVDHEGPNHNLMRKLAESLDRNETSKDLAFGNLQMQMAAAVQWREAGNESLTIVYRSPFASLWEMLEMPPMDANPAVFPAKPGAKWKEKDVRKWMFDFGYPTINIRIMEKSYGEFPEARYYGWGSTVGSALIFANLSGDNEFKTQFQISRVLRPWAEKYRGKLRFSFVERAKSTSKLRAKFSIGVDTKVESEMLLIDDILKYSEDDDRSNRNHAHGNPSKYRLRNFSQEAVDKFFEDYEKRVLPTYWVSKEPWTWGAAQQPKGESERLTGANFDSWVFDESPKRARLVGFFNDDPEDGCVSCVSNRPVWEQVAKAVKATKRLRAWFDIASIDQSANEHSEARCPGKLGNNLVFFYPPGSRKERKRNSRQLHELAAHFHLDTILGKLEDMTVDMEDGEL